MTRMRSVRSPATGKPHGCVTRTEGLAMVDAPQGWHRGRPRSSPPAEGKARRARPQASDSDQRHRGGSPGRPGVELAPAGAATTFSFGRVSSQIASQRPGQAGKGTGPGTVRWRLFTQRSHVRLRSEVMPRGKQGFRGAFRVGGSRMTVAKFLLHEQRFRGNQEETRSAR